MAPKDEPRHWLKINRAPVLTLWATVVAERLGFQSEEALTLGRAVAGLNAYSKGKALGLFRPTPSAVKAERSKQRREGLSVDLLGRAVPATTTEEGLRALSKEKPLDPDAVRRYLEKKFGSALDDATAAMRRLAAALAPQELAERAYALYEVFRPEVAGGKKGWGQEGRLDLDRIREMARETREGDG